MSHVAGQTLHHIHTNPVLLPVRTVFGNLRLAPPPSRGPQPAHSPAQPGHLVHTTRRDVASVWVAQLASRALFPPEPPHALELRVSVHFSFISNTLCSPSLA